MTGNVTVGLLLALALNRTMPDSSTPAFVDITNKAKAVFAGHAQGAQQGNANDARSLLGQALKTRDLNRPDVYAALATLSDDVANGVRSYGSISRIPAAATPNMRNDMYLASEAIRFLLKDKENNLNQSDVTKLNAYKKSLDNSTKFIPLWVKIAVAIALGLGTIIGWKRIVITVGEKIGKTHLTYAQGAAAELVAAGTIGAADVLGLPVSTTHVLSSGVAGTMAVRVVQCFEVVQIEEENCETTRIARRPFHFLIHG